MATEIRFLQRNNNDFGLIPINDIIMQTFCIKITVLVQKKA